MRTKFWITAEADLGLLQYQRALHLRYYKSSRHRSFLSCSIKVSFFLYFCRWCENCLIYFSNQLIVMKCIWPLMTHERFNISEGVAPNKLYRFMFVWCDSLFFLSGFSSQTVTIHRTAGEERGPSFIPLYLFHPLTNILTFICNFQCERATTYY